MSTFIHRLIRGIIAGLVATIPMTLLMEWWFRRLPRQQQYPLPPGEIVGQVAERVGVDMPSERPRGALVTLVAHFAYGGATGAGYALIAPRSNRAAAVAGIAYAMGVWVVSYLGLLPALGVLRPATEHPAERNRLMIAAHAVWGLVLGLVTARLARRAR